jgi:hypothetical protein
MSRFIPHCAKHFGFPLPCIQCKQPIKQSEASSVRARLPALTTQESRRQRESHAARAAHEALARRRGSP